MPTYQSPGVYVEEVDRGSKPIEGVGTAVAAFVGFTAVAPMDDPNDPSGAKPRRVTNWSQFERLYGGFTPGALLPHAVYGYFNNGGGSAWIVRVPHTQDAAPAGSAHRGLTAAAKPEHEVMDVTALDPGHQIEVAIEPNPPGEGEEPSGSFTFKVFVDGQERELFENLTFGKGGQHVETVVNHDSTAVKVKVKGAGGLSVADRVPAPGKYQLEVSLPARVEVTDQDFAGSESERTGVGGLTIADDVTMVCVPDLMTAVSNNGDVDLDMFKAVQSQIITHCELTGDRMAILDPPPGMSAQQVAEWRQNTAMFDSKFATLYYPWIKVANPLAGPGSDEPRIISMPPSGHMAGIWARNDDTRGVWKAPANEVVRGALDVDLKITKGEQDLLNPMGVNCIRPFGTRGIRVWGARTLSSDPSWRYVNVRRLFNFVEESVMLGTQWVVFEPNDMDLWQRVKRTINAFLIQRWREGALFGATPEEAFYVKCDAETNPPESVDEGKLVVEIGIAPVKPAEFVIFRISQWQGGAATAE